MPRKWGSAKWVIKKIVCIKRLVYSGNRWNKMLLVHFFVQSLLQQQLSVLLLALPVQDTLRDALVTFPPRVEESEQDGEEHKSVEESEEDHQEEYLGIIIAIF